MNSQSTIGGPGTFLVFGEPGQPPVVVEAVGATGPARFFDEEEPFDEQEELEPIVTAVVFKAPVVAAPVVTPVAAAPVAAAPQQSHLMAADEDWTWQQLRDYVVDSISRQFGNFPRDPVREKAIFSGFLKRWGATAPKIARMAFEFHGGWWRNSPISVNRFTVNSDPYFAEEIAKRISTPA